MGKTRDEAEEGVWSWEGGGGGDAHWLYRRQMMCLFYTLGLMTACVIAAKWQRLTCPGLEIINAWGCWCDWCYLLYRQLSTAKTCSDFPNHLRTYETPRGKIPCGPREESGLPDKVRSSRGELINRCSQVQALAVWEILLLMFSQLSPGSDFSRGCFIISCSDRSGPQVPLRHGCCAAPKSLHQQIALLKCIQVPEFDIYFLEDCIAYFDTFVSSITVSRHLL